MRLLEFDTTQVGGATRSVLATRYAVCRWSQGRYADARRWGNLAVAEAEAATDILALARAHLVLHLVALYAPGTDPLPHGEWALDIFTQLGDLSGQAHCLNNLAMRAAYEGRWSEAVTTFRRAAEGFRRIGDSANEANSLYNVADMLVRQGRIADAEPLLHHALRVARAVDDEELVALVLRESGRAAARSGQAQEALALLTQARDRLAELGEPHEVVDAEVAIAESLLIDGHSSRALELADAALARAEALRAATLIPTLARVRGLALLEQGDVAASIAALESGLAASEDPAVRHEQAFLLAARAAAARAAGDDHAEDWARRAGELLSRLDVVALPVPARASWLIDLGGLADERVDELNPPVSGSRVAAP
jgi:tetratricopeptide (TPR) repeat protein